MNMVRKLQNPVALVVEGFLAGALLFGAVNPSFLHPASSQADAQATALVQELTR
jgi:hypothetical protein